jgi:hypothetical protein
MRRESIYVCTYTTGDEEQVAYVAAWDDHEAAELLARELELESEGAAAVSVGQIRVRPVFQGERSAQV